MRYRLGLAVFTTQFSYTEEVIQASATIVAFFCSWILQKLTQLWHFGKISQNFYLCFENLKNEYLWGYSRPNEFVLLQIDVYCVRKMTKQRKYYQRRKLGSTRVDLPLKKKIIFIKKIVNFNEPYERVSRDFQRETGKPLPPATFRFLLIWSKNIANG